MTEKTAERPIIVHCIALLIQHRTTAHAEDALLAAWDIYRYLGEPKRLFSHGEGDEGK